MFPNKLTMDYENGCTTEIDVVKALRKGVPKYLQWLEDESPFENDEDPKFAYDDIQQVDVMVVDTSVDPLYDIDVWGVGLRARLSSGKFFLVYLPMHYESVLEEIYSYWTEIMMSIQIVDADTDVFQLPQMKVWRSNLFRYVPDTDTFVLTKQDLMS